MSQNNVPFRHVTLSVAAAHCPVTGAAGWCYHLRYECDQTQCYKHLQRVGSLDTVTSIDDAHLHGLKKGVEKMVTALNIRFAHVVLNTSSKLALSALRDQVSYWGLPPDGIEYQVTENIPPVCQQHAVQAMIDQKNLLLDLSR